MIAISAICMTIAHPGIYFPTISSRNRPVAAEEKAEAGEKSSMSSRQGDSQGEESVMAERP